MNNKNTPILSVLLSIAYTLLVSITSKFGTVRVNESFGHTLFFGPLMLIIALTLPISKKELREIFWSKKNLIIFAVGLAVTLPITIICLVNKYSIY